MTSVWLQFLLIFTQPTQYSSVYHLRLRNNHRCQPVSKPKPMSYPLITYLNIFHIKVRFCVCNITERQTKIEPINFLKPNIPAYLLEKCPPISCVLRDFEKKSLNHRTTQSPYQSPNDVDMLFLVLNVIFFQSFLSNETEDNNLQFTNFE